MRGRDVEPECPLEVAGGHVEKGAWHPSAEIVHDDVEPSEAFERDLSKGARRRRIREVESDDLGSAAGLHDAVGDRFEVLRGPCSDDDVRPASASATAVA